MAFPCSAPGASDKRLVLAAPGGRTEAQERLRNEGSFWCSCGCLISLNLGSNCYTSYGKPQAASLWERFPLSSPSPLSHSHQPQCGQTSPATEGGAAQPGTLSLRAARSGEQGMWAGGQQHRGLRMCQVVAEPLPCARYRASAHEQEWSSQCSLSLLVEIWGRQSSSLKSSYILLFCKSICLNTFRLKGKSVSAFQDGRSPWVRLAVYAQSVCVCVFVCVYSCVRAHSPPAHLPGVPVSLCSPAQPRLAEAEQSQFSSDFCKLT